MNLQTKNTKKILYFALTICVLFSMIAPALPFAAANAPKILTYYIFDSPYANVDWETYGQYKANLHTHTAVSPDSSALVRNMVEEYYKQGFDILSINDHMAVSKEWDKYTTAQGALTTDRYDTILSGEDRDGRGMIQIPISNEQNGAAAGRHVLSYFADYNAIGGGLLNLGLTSVSYEQVVIGVDNAGGLLFFAHPGRQTGAPANPTAAQVSQFTDLFLKYPNSVLGYEIFGVSDGETKYDRVLWDRSLMITAPQGKNIFGLANDDAHNVDAIGRNNARTMFLMPENTVANFRTAMETGAFYASSRMGTSEGVNGDGNLPLPTISSISIDGNVVSVEGDSYNVVEWIADGKIIATGNSIDLLEYKDDIGSYIRFQLIGEGGITWANPILLQRVDAALVDVVAEASVRKLSGNQNELTITVTETYAYAKTNVISAVFMINNNVAGSYNVGEYVVYVDTKGNDQIRACYIVEGCEIKIEVEANEASVIVEVNVEKTSGNTNELTIAVTDESGDVTEETYIIDNNVVGTYQVGEYVVYVDTKGNDQIRDSYIVQ